MCVCEGCGEMFVEDGGDGICWYVLFVVCVFGL